MFLELTLQQISSWKTKFESEEFSKYLGHKHPQMLCDRNFRKTLGGPGNYEIRGELPTGPSVLKNVGFGTGERFHSPIKDEKLPPGNLSSFSESVMLQLNSQWCILCCIVNSFRFTYHQEAHYEILQNPHFGMGRL